MRKAVLYCAVMLSVTATASSAAGLHLRWTSCHGENGTQNRAFTCDTNTGKHILAGSFVLDANIPEVSGDELVVDIATASSTLPDWWRFKSAGACRATALWIAPQDGAACPDLFEGMATMSIATYDVGLHGANSARIVSLGTVPEAAIFNLYSAQEYGIAKWTLGSSKTVGTGACGGCTTPACIVFNSARILTEDGLGDTLLTGGATPGSNHVTWQGGGGTDCPATTPVRNLTWGAVKSLYR